MSDDLANIQTPWPDVERACRVASDAETLQARGRVLGVYSGAVHKRILAATRDENVAADLAQDFAVRLLQGHYRNADRRKGKFRHYLNRVVRNLTVDFYRLTRKERNLCQQVARDAQPASIAASEVPTGEFEARSRLLENTWRRLKENDHSHRPPYYEALELRVKHPSENMEELSERFAETHPGYTPESLRQVICRARRQFRKLLRDEIAKSIGTRDPESIWQEASELGLSKYFPVNPRPRAGAAIMPPHPLLSSNR